MRKLFLGFLVLAAFICFYSSCKQCNQPKDNNVVKTDTTGIPGVEAASLAIQKDSLNADLWYKRAQLYAENSEFKNATTDMYVALQLDSLRPEFYLFTADLFKNTGEENKADLKRGIALMQKAIALDSTNTKFYVKAAELAFLDTSIERNYAIAISYLDAAIARDPQNADIYFYKGNIFKEIGDTTKAISSFKTATELNPQYYEAFRQIGMLLKAKNDKNAIKYLDNAIKVSDKPVDALYAKAEMLKQEGVRLYDGNKTAAAIAQLQGAIDCYKKVIDINYRNEEAYMGVGFCYYQMDSVQDAYEYYDKAVKIAPTYAGAYFSKGVCAEDLGKIEEAKMLFENCLSIDPDFTRAKEHLQRLQGAQ
ncbi:MAG: tetratricopeptide repeat protein [Chitinophagales bacterium]